MDIHEQFWNASVQELMTGYSHDKETDRYVCLVCGEVFQEGRIYPSEGLLFDAHRFASIHITKEHGSMLDYLLSLDKKLTSLTDHQRHLVQAFYEGQTDAAIAETQGASLSTIRSQRFQLRERAKQARVFLAIMGLMETGAARGGASGVGLVPVHRTATTVDERYLTTTLEREKILREYFPTEMNGRLKTLPRKEKRKIVVLREIITHFELGKQYSEKQVNEILKSIFDDFVTLRRYLIEYGFMDRKDDGSRYWVRL